MPETILQVKGLCYAYEAGRQALQDISLDIRRGERIAVLGTNGAGKSTFFLCLNGVLEPQEGQILLHGKPDGRSRNGLREHVGIVFQNADDQMIASTVLAEISFGPMNLRLPLPEVERRVDMAVRAMDLDDYRNRPPHYLSGGEKKRVSIADIIAMEPEVILFDEPAASLDPAGTEMLEQLLDNLSAAGKTLMIATHDMDFAFRWASRVLVFSQGRVIADGQPLTVFQEETIIRQASLRQPAMLAVFQSLCAHGLLPEGLPCPRTPAALDTLLGTLPVGR